MITLAKKLWFVNSEYVSS